LGAGVDRLRAKVAGLRAKGKPLRAVSRPLQARVKNVTGGGGGVAGEVFAIVSAHAAGYFGIVRQASEEKVSGTILTAKNGVRFTYNRLNCCKSPN